MYSTMSQILPLKLKLFAGFGRGEAGRERSEDGRAAAV